MDLPAVQIHDPSGDREAEARAAVARGARRVGAVEAFEHARLLGLGDARALVEHLDRHAVGAAPGAHLDRAAARRVPHRVLEQVRDHLMDALGVARGGEVGGLDADRDPDRGLVQLLLAHRVLEEGFDGELGALERAARPTRGATGRGAA